MLFDYGLYLILFDVKCYVDYMYLFDVDYWMLMLLLGVEIDGEWEKNRIL